MSEDPSKAPLHAPTEPKHFRSSAGMPFKSRLRPEAQLQTQPSNASGSRHSSNPIVRSPLQQSFPAYPNPVSGEDTNTNSVLQATPSRRSRRSEQETRKRGESRSSSVPIIVRTLEEDSQSDTSNQLQARTRPHSRATSPLSHAHGRDHGRDHESSANPLNPNANRRSVKHLTCFWWWEKGECRFSEEECLYAHHDTGHYTLAPRQVTPGEPAKAGKSLERALNKLAITNRSSASLSSLADAHAHTHASHITAGNLNSSPSSRSESPQHAKRSRSSTPSPLDIGQAYAQAKQQLREDNDFLRRLVQETQREKRALVDTIESLQTEKTSLQSRIEAMSSEMSNLLVEREVLQATVKKLQFANTTAGSTGTSMRSPTGGFGPTLSQSPWGAIGSRRPSPVESLQQSYRAVSDGSVDQVKNNLTSFGGSDGSAHASLNPAAKPYAEAKPTFHFGNDSNLFGNSNESNVNSEFHFGNDFGSLGNGNESEELESVLRNLGPSF